MKRRGWWRSCLYAAACLGLAAGAAYAQSSSPAPSSPPFWAQPPAAGPDCACPDGAHVTQPAPERGFSPTSGLLLAGVAVALLLLLWRAQGARARRAAAVAAARKPAPAASAAPPISGAFPPDQRLPEVPLETPEPLPEPGTPAAHAFFKDAAVSLADALRKNPARQDLRGKLLEMYFAAGMPLEFLNEAHTFLEQNHGAHDEPWSEIVRMGHQLLPEHALFRAEDGAAIRRKVQFRRYYDRKVDQSLLHSAQQSLGAAFEQALREGQWLEGLRALVPNAPALAPLTPATELGPTAGATLYLKRVERQRIQAHVRLNALGQVLLAQRLGKTGVTTATRDGAHGLATAAAAARLGLRCVVFITEADLALHYAQVLSLRKLGAMVRPVRLDGGARFSDPRQHALQFWVEQPQQQMYVSSLAAGPAPFPEIVSEIAASIGHEAIAQLRAVTDRLPAAVVVSAADGQAGMGLLRAFLPHAAVRLYCLDHPGDAAADGPPLLRRTRREHAWLRASGRVHYESGDGGEALHVTERFHAVNLFLTQPTARSLAYAQRLARHLTPQDSVLALLSNQDDLASSLAPPGAS